MMESNAPQYQRAVTPTVDATNAGNSRAKMLPFQNAATARKGKVTEGQPILRNRAAAPKNVAGAPSLGMNIQGRSASGKATGIADKDISTCVAGTMPRYDLVPMSEEVPADGIVFARVKNFPDLIVCFRTPEERAANPERINLDRRQLDMCPLLEQEQKLRLLNYQNNNIRAIRNIENLTNLIFLDMYNNKLTSLDGPISSVHGLRVLMAGKNRIARISNLLELHKLDVLDLHSNEISCIQGLEGLAELRVLNLAGNHISKVEKMTNLQALTELNLRRNNINSVTELDALPALQRVFLSHNLIASVDDVKCLMSIKFLIELSLDGNPLADPKATAAKGVHELSYRLLIIEKIPNLRHLDLKNVTVEEREDVARHLQQRLLARAKSSAPPLMSSATWNDDSSQAEYFNSNDAMEESWPNGKMIGSESLDAGDKKQWKIFLQPKDSNGENVTITGLTTGGSLPSTLRMQPPVGRESAATPDSVFEIEVIGPNEKSLLISGDKWDWIQSKKILQAVTKLTLVSMSNSVVYDKFGVVAGGGAAATASAASYLPSLKSVTFIDSGFCTLSHLHVIAEVFGGGLHPPLHALYPQLEEVIIHQNKAPSSAQPSDVVFDDTSPLVRQYVIMLMPPSLKTFNMKAVSKEERNAAKKQFKVMGGLLQGVENGSAQSAVASVVARPPLSKVNSMPSTSSSKPLAGWNGSQDLRKVKNSNSAERSDFPFAGGVGEGLEAPSSLPPVFSSPPMQVPLDASVAPPQPMSRTSTKQSQSQSQQRMRNSRNRNRNDNFAYDFVRDITKLTLRDKEIESEFEVIFKESIQSMMIQALSSVSTENDE